MSNSYSTITAASFREEDIQAAAEERARILGYPPNGPWTVSIDLPDGRSRSISKGRNPQMIPSASEMARYSDFPEKSFDRTTAILLCLFLGIFGAHKFYLNQIGLGVIYFLFCWTFIPVILSIIDLVRMVTMRDEEFHFEYNRNY